MNHRLAQLTFSQFAVGIKVKLGAEQKEVLLLSGVGATSVISYR